MSSDNGVRMRPTLIDRLEDDLSDVQRLLSEETKRKAEAIAEAAQVKRHLGEAEEELKRVSEERDRYRVEVQQAQRERERAVQVDRELQVVGDSLRRQAEQLRVATEERDRLRVEVEEVRAEFALVEQELREARAEREKAARLVELFRQRAVIDAELAQVTP